jgi:hypothetical protein
MMLKTALFAPIPIPSKQDDQDGEARLQENLVQGLADVERGEQMRASRKLR